MSNGSVAFMAGCWGQPQELCLPLCERGLQLADGLFETVLVLEGAPQLLDAHLRRWQGGASLLSMEPPPGPAELQPLIKEAIHRAGLKRGSGALRLNWSRGDGQGRGIDLPEDPRHRFWLQLSPLTPLFSPQSAIISRHERRNSASRLSRCKTFAYGQAIQARLEARQAGADEALLLGSSGELSCGATSNLLIWRHSRWLTPPLSSGCLPGVMRGRLLELGLAEEAALHPEPEPGDQWCLINSLGCRPLQSVNGQPLALHHDAETLWRSLL